MSEFIRGRVIFYESLSIADPIPELSGLYVALDVPQQIFQLSLVPDQFGLLG